MALRDFTNPSESGIPLTGVSAFSFKTNGCQTASNVNARETIESASDWQNVAVTMEQTRQRLQEMLLLHPLAYQMSLELIAAQKDRASEYCHSTSVITAAQEVVQHGDIVQPRTTDASMNATSIVEAVSYDENIDAHNQPESSHFFPVTLINITDQLLKAGSIDLYHQTQLRHLRNQLKDLRQQTIANHIGLVSFIAQKYRASVLSFDDLMQEGTVGLIKAVDRFDPTRGIRFSTYAVFWIKQAISRLIIKQEKVIRLPIALAEKAYVVFDAMRTCYLEHNRWPNLTELQSICELSLEDIKTISNYYQATHSLDASLSSEENDAQTMMSTLVQHQFALPLDELIHQNLSLYLDKIVGSLPEKEATILNMRFGLQNHTEMTLQAIADQLHVTRERVRQIQNEALKKLKQQFGYDLLPFLEPNDS